MENSNGSLGTNSESVATSQRRGDEEQSGSSGKSAGGQETCPGY